MPTIEVKANDTSNLQSIAQLFLSSTNIVVITGAGISTNSGIPDFRSSGGLYSTFGAFINAATRTRAASSVDNTISTQDQPGNNSRTPGFKGQDLFHKSALADPARRPVLYQLCTAIREVSGNAPPTTTHHFIRHLKDRDKLARCYTQNIDRFEQRVGLTVRAEGSPELEVDCVMLHGSLEALRCNVCHKVCEWDENRLVATAAGKAPQCPNCEEFSTTRQIRGKRTTKIGSLRPDILLYDEHDHTYQDTVSSLVKHDLNLCADFLIILGTSLKVHGVQNLVRDFAKAVHLRGGKVVFVNLTKPSQSAWGQFIDYWVDWDCDQWISDLKERIPRFWQDTSESAWEPEDKLVMDALPKIRDDHVYLKVLRPSTKEVRSTFEEVIMEQNPEALYKYWDQRPHGQKRWKWVPTSRIWEIVKYVPRSNKLTIHWLGYRQAENTNEPLELILAIAPGMVRAFCASTGLRKQGGRLVEKRKQRR